MTALHRKRWRAREQRADAEARARRCPKCGAKPGEDCWSTYHPPQRITWLHDERRRRA